MSFGPAEMAAVALGALFREQIWNAFWWPFKKLWQGSKWLFIAATKIGRDKKRASRPASEATQIIDITPTSRHIS